MKKYFAAVMVGLVLLADISQGAEIANTRIYCLSLRFDRGVGPFNLYSLDFTGINNGINGELYPVFGQPRTHYTTLILTDESDEEIPGSMFLDVPDTDVDGDGFADIFDSTKPFSGTSSGIYSFAGSPNRTVPATWSRAAGSTAGTCQLNFPIEGTFTHTFHILEYKGPLSYMPGSNTVSANANLTLTGGGGSSLNGPLTFTKSEGDPFNQLARDGGEWTNDVAQPLGFTAFPLLRDSTWPTNYYGYFEFDDWNLSTAESDYYLWILSIDDLNDADGDGIPDLSDDPQTAVARRPLLSLSRAATNLSLTISGNVGQVCQIQEAATVDAASWPTIQSVTLTNDPQTISLPLPVGTRFWRVSVP